MPLCQEHQHLNPAYGSCAPLHTPLRGRQAGAVRAAARELHDAATEASHWAHIAAAQHDHGASSTRSVRQTAFGCRRALADLESAKVRLSRTLDTTTKEVTDDLRPADQAAPASPDRTEA